MRDQFQQNQIIEELQNIFCAFQSIIYIKLSPEIQILLCIQLLSLCGELYSYLRKQNRFIEKRLQYFSFLKHYLYRYKARKYIDYLRWLSKFVDFVLSKIINNKNHQIIVHLAPKMVEYNYTQDYYQLGVIFYGMIVGIPPFYVKTRSDMIKNIFQKSKISFKTNYKILLLNYVIKTKQRNYMRNKS
ncbi:unnamed protein product [Paramecium sonneborni]|uniref:Protein kinase domain protein n=1 Tax=Paramecium sonneborni TaxID=65129 RepID=A0A8S1R684_9CILI|nr:unnamed protein product [Paramecium sonneborni]